MKQRVITSLLLAPVVLAVSGFGSPYPLFVVCLTTATLGFWELRKLTGSPKSLPVLTLFGLAVPFFGTEVQSNRSPIQVILYGSLFWLVGIYFAQRVVKARSSTSAVDVAGLWISMPLTCLMMVHKLTSANGNEFSLTHAYIFLILIPLWAGDTGALAVGRQFGKHLLWPAVSPNKSWEGAIANMILSTLTAGLLAIPLRDQGRLPLFLLCGAAIGLVGQLGDLFESQLKRTAKVKDSGSILPGHGGILDRIDSLLFAAPVVSLILVFALSTG